MNPSRSRLERESDVACENQDNVVCQFCQDQDHDPQGTKEKLREYDDADRVGEEASHSYACCAFGLITVVGYLLSLLRTATCGSRQSLLFFADAAAVAASSGTLA